MVLGLASLVLASLFAACGGGNELILATTTSTQDSGLLETLVAAFERQTGYHVKPIAVGSGQALRLGEEGEADVLLVHSPEAEEAFMAAGHGVDRRLVMHNDFVIVGPAADPADVSGLESASEAMAKIARAGSTFFSRGDESGTHAREKKLWADAGLAPFQQPWYKETGQGMGQTLFIANEKDGYALADRGTYLALKERLRLVVLLEGGAGLLNVYHVIVVNPDESGKVNAEGARAFADFVTSSQGQEIIRTFGVEQYGEPLFYPDAGLAAPGSGR
ncbi:MAG: substrate-binding domain-containing protein [Chloroflexi bacterium]|nr:substrate-binding domain-containing protein [Chloroflexota bacterium]